MYTVYNTHNIKIHNSHVCHCAFDAIVQMLNLKTKGRVRALWVRSPPCLDGHRQGHQCVVRADCGAGQTDGRPDSRVMAGRWSAQ